MIEEIRTGGSLRFWVGVGMTLAVLPLATSAVLGFLIVHRGVIGSFDDVAARQRHQIAPTQRLRLSIWDTVAPVDETLEEGDATRVAAYRNLRVKIESDFAELHGALESEPEARSLVERARASWTEADRLATEGTSLHRSPGDPRGAELLDRFHGEVEAAVDTLGAVYTDLSADVREDHDHALLAYERSEWVAGIAAGISLVTILVGVLTIGRIMRGSVDRLVEGAERFAGGDREHRIEVRVPPELHRVAQEFNRMIGRIRESELALSDLARRDALTQLYNRRAFDEALEEVTARMKRFGEPTSLLTLDLDHFKRINDAHGHAAGDETLRSVARTLTSALRPFDRAYRIGGEEFSVLLPGTEASAAGIVAERLRQAMETQAVSADGEEIEVTVSIGVATFSEDLETQTVLEAADAALYRAKEGGRNRIVVDGESDPPTL